MIISSSLVMCIYHPDCSLGCPAFFSVSVCNTRTFIISYVSVSAGAAAAEAVKDKYLMRAMLKNIAAIRYRALQQLWRRMFDSVFVFFFA